MVRGASPCPSPRRRHARRHAVAMPVATPSPCRAVAMLSPCRRAVAMPSPTLQRPASAPCPAEGARFGALDCVPRPPPTASLRLHAPSPLGRSNACVCALAPAQARPRSTSSRRSSTRLACPACADARSTTQHTAHSTRRTAHGARRTAHSAQRSAHVHVHVACIRYGAQQTHRTHHRAVAAPLTPRLHWGRRLRRRPSRG